MGILDSTVSGLDEAEMLRRRHSQIRTELKAQEDATDKAFAKYNEVAAKLSALWKQHSEIVMFGDKAVRSLTKENAKYPEFAKLQLAKQEAHEAWQIEANKHGRYVMAAERAMNVPPPGMQAGNA